MSVNGNLAGTVPDAGGSVYEVAGSVTLSGPSGPVSISGTVTSVPPPPGPALWSTKFGLAPTEPMLTIDEPVLLDIDATCFGAEVIAGGELIFDPDTSLLLRVDGHALCARDGGIIRMRPSAMSLKHEVRFINIDEAGFTEGGDVMDPHANPGLCVENGRLDIHGTYKQPWTITTAALGVGQTILPLQNVDGWQVGDEIVIAPSEDGHLPDAHKHHERRTITAISGTSVTVAALTYAHPLAHFRGVTEYPEVINLTRNVVISGDTEHNPLGPLAPNNGRAHIMIMGTASSAQVFAYAEVKHMGPRKPDPAFPVYTLEKLGRYALHFHRCGDGSRGSLIEGCSLHDLGNRGYVPHASHGITFRNCTVYNYAKDGFWWDTSDATLDVSHDVLIEWCVAAAVRYHRHNAGRLNTGFMLSAGENPIIRHCVAFGLDGSINACGFQWPEALNHHPLNVWTFEDNKAHNNKAHGTYAWQNDGNPHVVTRLRCWNNASRGIYHGAYRNNYEYHDCEAWGNNLGDFRLEAQSSTTKQLLIQGGGFPVVEVGKHHAATVTVPVRFLNVAIGTVNVTENPNSKLGKEDFIDCDLGPTSADWTITNMAIAGSVIRIQQGISAWQIVPPGTLPATSIPVFYP